MPNLLGMAAPATAACPNAPAPQAGNPYKLAAERQAPSKEARRSAYAAERARPYPQAKHRITRYEEAPHREPTLPASLRPPPPPPTHPPTEALLRAIWATRASTA